MISGHGVDVLGIERIREAWEQMGEVLPRSFLGEKELETFRQILSENKDLAVNYLAKRYCAKEALFKAVGTGMRAPFQWSDAQLLNDKYGKPYFEFGGMLMCEVKNRRVHVSVSDHSGIVMGSVIIENA